MNRRQLLSLGAGMAASFVVLILLLSIGAPLTLVVAGAALAGGLGVDLLIAGRVALGAGLLASLGALITVSATNAEVPSLGVALLILLVPGVGVGLLVDGLRKGRK